MRDKLSFTLSATFNGASESYPLLDPAINGQSLIEMVREAELPFATAEGRPHLAGEYSGILAQVVLLPSRYFLGEPL